MERIGRLARRIRMLLRRGSVEHTLTAEIQHHIDCEIEQLVRRGVPADAARKQALAAFGGIEQIKEEVRDARGIRAVEDIAADLGYAVRVLRHNPGFTIASVLTFGLGVGVATAIFSVVYGVLLRPLPYDRPERLMALWERDTAHSVDRNVVSLENFEAWRKRSASFTDTAALMPTSVTLNQAGEAERLIGAEVSPGYFGLLGVSPALGRDFVQADSAGALVTILSDAMWKRYFGGNPGVVGRVITISGKRCTIVGIMPATFEPPRFGWLGGQALWFPMVTSPERRGWGRFLLVVGRLRDEVTVEQARAELRAVASQLETENPSDRGWSASVLPLVTEMTGDVRTTLLVLLGAVALLLAIAVTNVGMLTLSAMRRREHELAVRRAIGATDGRLFRQLFVQSLVLGALGSGAGFAVAPIGVGILLSILPPDVPRVRSIHVDGPVLAITAAAAMLATLIFGTVAAIQGRKGAVLSMVAETVGDQRTTARNGGGTLTAVEMALAVTLSVMALLMVRTVAGLRSVDLGFNPGGVALARLALPEDRYASEASQRMFFERLVGRVRALPGVTAAGVVSTRPLGGLGPATTVTDPNSPAAAMGPSPVADVRIADRAAFHALRVPLVSGRLFDDMNHGDPVEAIISRSLARRFWPDRDAVGEKLTLAMYGTLTAEVIGVVDDIHLMDPRTPVRPAVFLSAARFNSPIRDLVVRVDAAPESAIPLLRSAVAALDSSLPLYAVTTLPDLVDTTLASERFTMYVLIAFAISALFLAAIGIFGVFIGDARRRRREIGIRLALGATESRVIGTLLGRSLQSAAVGIAAGIALATVLARTMSQLLFGVGPTDPLSLASVAGVALTVAVVATLLSAVRAIRQSALAALREG